MHLLRISSFAFVAACMACSSSGAPLHEEPADSGDAQSVGNDAAVTMDAMSETTVDTGPSQDLGPVPASDLAGCTRDPGALPATAEGSPFDLDHATVGFPKGEGRWTAKFTFGYEIGPTPTVVCVLDPVRAPVHVAQFIGLARGQKKYRNSSVDPYGFGKYYEPLNQGMTERIDGVLIQFGSVMAELSPGFWHVQEAKDAPKRAAPLIAQVAFGAASSGPSPGNTTVGALVFAVEDNIDPKTTRLGACDVESVRELTKTDHMRIAKVEIARCP